MIRINEIYRAAAVVMTICALFVTSCQKPAPTVDVLDVSVKTPSVASGKGQLFVNVKSNGSWTLYLADALGGSDVDWASLNVTSGEGNMSNVVLSYSVNASEEPRKLEIILDNGSRWVSCTVEQAASGKQPEPEIDPTPLPDIDLSRTGWLELPAMDNPDLGYYTHSFEMGGRRYRNYSFGWSQKDRVALWVAYPNSRLYLNGSVGRTDAWALDPLLGELSAAPFGGYAGPYARGHQLPSADRQCCYEANAQTFYGTNMTPQLNAHNEGIWADLEGKVRTISKSSDTTYVVTGVVLSPESKKEKDSNGQSVTIPDAYFKVLLKYSKASTLGQWNAAAFYLEHKAYSEQLGRQHSMSVDELEEITGIDFFVNLPEKVGAEQAAKLEAADPAESSVWW